MEKVRIGIIGVGQIGKSHLRNYAKIEAAEVVAVADINEAEAGPRGGRILDPHTCTPTFATCWSGTTSRPWTCASTTTFTCR